MFWELEVCRSILGFISALEVSDRYIYSNVAGQRLPEVAARGAQDTECSARSSLQMDGLDFELGAHGASIRHAAFTPLLIPFVSQISMSHSFAHLHTLTEGWFTRHVSTAGSLTCSCIQYVHSYHEARGLRNRLLAPETENRPDFIKFIKPHFRRFRVCLSDTLHCGSPIPQLCTKTSALVGLVLRLAQSAELGSTDLRSNL